MKLRVLLADDHTMFRKAMRMASRNQRHISLEVSIDLGSSDNTMSGGQVKFAGQALFKAEKIINDGAQGKPQSGGSGQSPCIRHITAVGRKHASLITTPVICRRARAFSKRMTRFVIRAKAGIHELG